MASTSGDSAESSALYNLISKRTITLLLSPVGLLLLSAGRLIIVSNYNTTTAITIASSNGYINTLLGTTIPLIPAFAPYLALLLLLFGRFFLSIIVFVFAAFITPTQITLAETLSLARADWNHLVSQFTGNQIIALSLALLAVAFLWFKRTSLDQAVGTVFAIIVTLALLSSTSSVQRGLPLKLQLASTGEHQIVAWFASNQLLLLVVLLVVVYGFLRYYANFPSMLTPTVAVLASLALFPYIYNIYPFPQQRSYYVGALQNLWLPAENIALKSGISYSGYVLSSDTGWFTVLLTNKSIVYLHVDDVLRRTVCQPQSDIAPSQYPPLISVLYSPPPATPACPRTVISATPASIRSHGQSLKSIASAVHVTPWHIISVTNAHHHEQLSKALRRYERARDWSAPTPIGQYFWYYPPVPSQLPGR
jgi:hypothetical protein